MGQDRHMSKNQKILLWVIVSILGIGIWCLAYFVRGNLHLIGAMDAFTISGVAILLLYGLYLVYRWGAFDMVIYGFKDLYYHMNFSAEKIRKYDDYGEYRERKKEERSKSKPYFWPFLVIGAILVITSIILRIILSVNHNL